MEELFEEVLALCLDRVADGDSPTSCAADFPEFADLEPLLQLADELAALPRREQRLVWLVASRDRFVADRPWRDREPEG